MTINKASLRSSASQMEDTLASKLSYVPYYYDYTNHCQAVPLSETTMPLEGNPVMSPAPSIIIDNAIMSPWPGSKGKYYLICCG
jgi:hypothetical protein